MKNKILFVSTAVLLCLPVFSQQGNLFIIGGGHKSKELMQQLVATAQLTSNDYIAFLPMATEEPDTSYAYIKEDFAGVCNNKVVNFNFTKNDVNRKAWLDSVQHAKLIYL
ncbi:MAG TPA: hypothetical protein VK796_09970, partial [Cytophaga sp.]|nr:hypothetical protein [Cytophaga sp.]